MPRITASVVRSSSPAWLPSAERKRPSPWLHRRRDDLGAVKGADAPHQPVGVATAALHDLGDA